MSDIFSSIFNINNDETVDSRQNASFAKGEQKSFQARLKEIAGELNSRDAETFYNDPFVRSDQKDGFA
ncbi:MAG: hypothetical protein HRT47_06135 [Candidatus Caenarcaniphilales bacterium]|nr:hypothetical protein [Candidatus Caenarcaniphilales bacterium]